MMGSKTAITDQPEGRGHPPADRDSRAEPRLLDGKPVKVAEKDDPRKALADVDDGRRTIPYFARATANWVWAQLFGKGLVDPPDDMSRANPPVHPELLDALARHFVAQQVRPAGPDPDDRDLGGLRPVVRDGRRQREGHAAVLASPAPPAHGPPDGRRPGPGDRRAEHVSAPLGARLAIKITDPSTPSAILDTFGRCPRTASCAPSQSAPLSASARRSS